MKGFGSRNVAMTIAIAGMFALSGRDTLVAKHTNEFLEARIVAIGIPGVSAISPVGNFLAGGPIHDNPVFATYTLAGHVLDPARILVASQSNFGAPIANSSEREGSFISIDPRGADTIVVPANFAESSGQASALSGRVQLFSAQSPPFRNGVNNSSAATAQFTGVSNPLGLSINNAFGRLWPANAPHGLEGIGTSTILDPTGIPLAGAPNPIAGGVFAGNLTPRLPKQLLPGALNTAAVGTAFLGRSPDGSTRAVFSVVLADGSIIQAHTLNAVDGIAAAGTVNALIGHRFNDDDEDDDNGAGALPRVGVILNYSPARILYVSEPLTNTIRVIQLTDDGSIFRVASVHRIHSDSLNEPIDLAPAELETHDPNWSSNTTLEIGADFYVANRGDNTIARMRQDGTVVAIRKVQRADGRPLGGARLHGIAVSPDGALIWATVSGHLPGWGKATGAVLEMPAFRNEPTAFRHASP
jgi:hypothetical protein